MDSSTIFLFSTLSVDSSFHNVNCKEILDISIDLHCRFTWKFWPHIRETWVQLKVWMRQIYSAQIQSYCQANKYTERNFVHKADVAEKLIRCCIM